MLIAKGIAGVLPAGNVATTLPPIADETDSRDVDEFVHVDAASTDGSVAATESNRNRAQPKGLPIRVDPVL